MKKTGRVFAVLLALMLCLQGMLPGALADDDSIWVRHALDFSGENLKVNIDMCGSDGNLLDAGTLDQLKPYYTIVTEEGTELERKNIQSATFSVTIKGSGVFGIEFHDCMGGSLGHWTTMNGEPVFELQSIWLDIQSPEETGEDLATLGLRFRVDAEIKGSSLDITLSPIKNATQTLAQMIDLYKPVVYTTWYDEDGAVIKNDEHFFKAGSGDTVQMTLTLDNAAGMESFVDCSEVVDDAGYCITVLEDGSIGDAVFALGTIPVYEQVVFDDVPQDVWYAEYVYSAVDCGLVQGKGEGRFAPNDNMTYAEAITLAARMSMAIYDVEDPGAASTGAWYQPYVDYAKTAGIPWQWADYNAKTTRADYVHIFYAAMPSEEYLSYNTVADGAIPDVSMQHPYAGEIYTFYRAGILAGSDSAHNFKPTDSIKRSEVAAILCRMFLGIELQQFTLK